MQIFKDPTTETRNRKTLELKTALLSPSEANATTYFCYVNCTKSHSCKKCRHCYHYGMQNDWQTRLKRAIEDRIEKGDSARAISLRAEQNPNYVNQMLGGSMPTVDRFLSVCKTLEVNPVEILTGIPQEPWVTRALQLLSGLNTDQRGIFLQMLESFHSALAGAGSTPAEQVDHPVSAKEFDGEKEQPLDMDKLIEAARLVRTEESDLSDDQMFPFDSFRNKLIKNYNELMIEPATDNQPQREEG